MDSVRTLNFAQDRLAFIKDEFIYGGHLLSLGAACISFVSAALLKVDITWDFLAVSYLIFYVIYAYNRFREMKEDSLTNPERTSHVAKYIKYAPFYLSVCALAIFCLLFKSGSLAGQILGVFMIVSGLFYSEGLKRVTARIVGFKTIYVSFVWALLPVLLVCYYSLPDKFPVFLVFSFVFLRFVVSTAFFDIKDIESDKANGLKTLPIFFGEKNTLFLLNAINLFSFFPIIFGFYKGLFPSLSFSLVIFYFYSLSYLRISKNKKVNIQKLSYMMVDGEYFLWGIAVFLFKLIAA